MKIANNTGHAEINQQKETQIHPSFMIIHSGDQKKRYIKEKKKHFITGKRKKREIYISSFDIDHSRCKLKKESRRKRKKKREIRENKAIRKDQICIFINKETKN